MANFDKQFHILVVDDDTLASNVLKEYLEALGYEVSVADGCREGAELLRKTKKIDLIILDYLMPHGNGTVLLQLLAQQDDLQRPPVIMSSSIIDPKSAAWQALYNRLPALSQSLIRAYVSKPYSFDSLHGVLHNILIVKEAAEPGQLLSGDYLSPATDFPAVQTEAETTTHKKTPVE